MYVVTDWGLNIAAVGVVVVVKELTIHCIKKTEEQIRENVHFSHLPRLQICCLCRFKPLLEKKRMTFVYGWKMEVEVVMTPYEEVYKEIQETK